MLGLFFFFKQKTAYELRISDWSSDVCSSDLDAFEIGSKNVFANGALQLNATAFYYKYSGLQLSRIVARTSVNDTVDANIWGVELESVIRPDPNWLFNRSEERSVGKEWVSTL